MHNQPFCTFPNDIHSLVILKPILEFDHASKHLKSCILAKACWRPSFLFQWFCCSVDESWHISCCWHCWRRYKTGYIQIFFKYRWATMFKICKNPVPTIPLYYQLIKFPSEGSDGCSKHKMSQSGHFHTQRTRKFKKSPGKKKFFWWNFIFRSFKLFLSSVIDFDHFWNCKKWNLAKKISWNWFIWLHEFFWPGLF